MQHQQTKALTKMQTILVNTLKNLFQCSLHLLFLQLVLG